MAQADVSLPSARQTEENQLVTFCLGNEEFGFDIPATYPSIGGWLDRIKALPGWRHPYDLMPGHPLPR